MKRFGFSGGQYHPLNGDQIETIHIAALRMLEEIGFTYEPGLEETLEMLEQSGAKIDIEKARFYLPRKLVMEQVEKAPSFFTLYSRDGNNDLELADDRVYMGTGGAAIKVLDLDTGLCRPTTLRDIFQIGKIVDRLENINFYLRPCVPADISEQDYDVNSFYACLKATSKHVMAGCNNEEGVRQVAGLGSIIAGSLAEFQQHPFMSIITSFAISPLKLCTQSTLNMQQACRLKIPVALSSAPMAGSTSPVTMAGSLAQLHAEELVGIVIGQLTNPGAPQLYGGIPGMAEMRSMGYRGGAVEFGMMNAAIHQLSAYINVPNYNSSGLSDSKLPDAQAGWEKAFTCVLNAMGGGNFIHHAAGMLESMLTVAYEQYVIDDEIIGMSMRALEGIKVDEEHIAFDAIREVGPGGNFLLSQHTVRHMRDEYFLGNGLSDLNSRDQWEADGSKDTRERAREMAQAIVAEPAKTHIPLEVDQKIKSRFKILL